MEHDRPKVHLAEVERALDPERDGRGALRLVPAQRSFPAWEPAEEVESEVETALPIHPA
jgi:hypothetical protein